MNTKAIKANDYFNKNTEEVPLAISGYSVRKLPASDGASEVIIQVHVNKLIGRDSVGEEKARAIVKELNESLIKQMLK